MFTLFLPDHFGADKALEHFTAATGVSSIEAQDGDPLLSLVGDRRVMALSFEDADFAAAVAFFAEHPYLSGCLAHNGERIVLQHQAGGETVLDEEFADVAPAGCRVARLPQAFL